MKAIEGVQLTQYNKMSKQFGCEKSAAIGALVSMVTDPEFHVPYVSGKVIPGQLASSIPFLASCSRQKPTPKLWECLQIWTPRSNQRRLKH